MTPDIPERGILPTDPTLSDFAEALFEATERVAAETERLRQVASTAPVARNNVLRDRIAALRSIADFPVPPTPSGRDAMLRDLRSLLTDFPLLPMPNGLRDHSGIRASYEIDVALLSLNRVASLHSGISDEGRNNLALVLAILRDLSNTLRQRPEEEE